MLKSARQALQYGLMLAVFLFVSSCARTKPHPDFNAEVISVDELVTSIDTSAPAWLQALQVDSLEILRSDTTEYVQVDDMKFLVQANPNGESVFGLGSDVRLMIPQPWPGGSLFYELSPEVAQNQFRADQFRRACSILLDSTGIRCVDRLSRTSPYAQAHLFVRASGQNSSFVGRTGGRQDFNIFNWENEIIIAHELKHALGWTHEHQRSDRDSYVRVNLHNVESGKLNNFTKMGFTDNSPYNFSSIMHYRSRDFSQNGSPTILPLAAYSDSLSVMGQRRYVTSKDIAEIQYIYGPRTVQWCGYSRLPSDFDERLRGTTCQLDCVSNGTVRQFIICNCSRNDECR